MLPIPVRWLCLHDIHFEAASPDNAFVVTWRRRKYRQNAFDLIHLGLEPRLPDSQTGGCALMRGFNSKNPYTNVPYMLLRLGLTFNPSHNSNSTSREDTLE